MRQIKKYLAVPNQTVVHCDKVTGSCQWINQREDFQHWRDGTTPDETTSSKSRAALYWINASPGAGKTFLASHVEKILQESKAQVAHYYFQTGAKSSRSLAPFLRSIAYQMALCSAELRDKLYNLWQNEPELDIEDTWTMWKDMFSSCIFQVRFKTSRRQKLSYMKGRPPPTCPFIGSSTR